MHCVSLSFFAKTASLPLSQWTSAQETPRAVKNNASVKEEETWTPSTPSTASPASTGSRFHRYLNLFALFSRCCYYSPGWTRTRLADGTITNETTVSSPPSSSSSSFNFFSSSSSSLLSTASPSSHDQQLAVSSNESNFSHSNLQVESEAKQEEERDKNVLRHQQWPSGESSGARDARILKIFAVSAQDEITSTRDEVTTRKEDETRETISTTSASVLDEHSWSSGFEDTSSNRENKQTDARQKHLRDDEEMRTAQEQLVGEKQHQSTASPMPAEVEEEGQEAQVEATTWQTNTHDTENTGDLSASKYESLASEMDLYSPATTQATLPVTSRGSDQESGTSEHLGNLPVSLDAATTTPPETTTPAGETITHARTSQSTMVNESEYTWLLQETSDLRQLEQAIQVTTERPLGELVSDLSTSASLQDDQKQVATSARETEWQTSIHERTTMESPSSVTMASAPETTTIDTRGLKEGRKEDDASDQVTTAYPESNFFPPWYLKNVNFNFTDASDMLSFLNRIIYHDTRLFEKAGDL